MPDNEKSKKNHPSMMGNIRDSHASSGKSICEDQQKLCKWGLIIGVPIVLLIIVIVVVVLVFSNK